MRRFCEGVPTAELPPSGGVFTTLRVAHGQAIDLAAHASRLVEHAGLAGLRPPAISHLMQVLRNVAAACGTKATLQLRALLVPSRAGAALWCEAGPYQFDPTPLQLHAVAWSPTRQAHVKFRDRSAYDVALGAAQAQGAHDALLCTPAGEWLETSRAALVVVSGHALLVSSSPQILASVGRARLLHLARELGLTVGTTRLDADLAHRGDELFVVNSLRGVMAVGWCDQISWPLPGPVTSALSRRYAAFVASHNFPQAPDTL